MPRPPVSPALRRDIGLKVWVNKRERATITRRAKKAGFASVADFMRWTALLAYSPDLDAAGDNGESRVERARRFAAWANSLSRRANQALVEAEKRGGA